MKLILLILLVATVYSVEFRKNPINENPLPQLLQIKDKSVFTKNLVSSLQLHLTSGGKVEEVIKYVREALANTQNERNALSVEFGSEMESYDLKIGGLNGDLRQMGTELDETIINIAELGKVITVLENKVEVVKNEIQNMNEREQNIRTARDNDMKAFSQRQARDQKAIDALQEIIPQLNDLLTGGTSLLEKTQEQLVQYLRNKDVSDPVRSLIQTSMKFNKAKLSTVISKLENILEAVQVGKDQDEQNEAESEQRFKDLIAEIERLRTAKTQELAQVNGKLQLKESELLAAQSNKDRLTINIESTTNLRDATQLTKDSTEANYKQRLADADASIQALQDALNILEGNEVDFTKQEQAADEVLA